MEKVTVEKTAAAMQVSDSNPMVGIEGRTSLLINLSKALKESPQFFGSDGRPGNVIGNVGYLPISVLIDLSFAQISLKANRNSKTLRVWFLSLLYGQPSWMVSTRSGPRAYHLGAYP